MCLLSLCVGLLGLKCCIVMQVGASCACAMAGGLKSWYGHCKGYAVSVQNIIALCLRT